jgi:hypothetical protein
MSSETASVKAGDIITVTEASVTDGWSTVITDDKKRVRFKLFKKVKFEKN